MSLPIRIESEVPCCELVDDAIEPWFVSVSIVLELLVPSDVSENVPVTSLPLCVLLDVPELEVVDDATEPRFASVPNAVEPPVPLEVSE